MDLSLEHTKALHTWIWWLYVKYLLRQRCMWTTFGKWNFLWAIFEYLMILFKQGAVDLSLEHTKVQHTWIWWLNVKYLRGQCSCGQLLGNQNFFGRLSNSSWQPLSSTLRIFHWNIPNHNILELGGWMWNICSASFFMWTTFGKSKFLWVIFE